MVVAWCGVVMFALSIASVGNPLWLEVNGTKTVITDRGFRIEVTTVGDCSLRTCSICESTPESSAPDCATGDPEDLTGVEQLTSSGVAVVLLHVIQIIAIPVLMAFAFIHGWSRFDSQILSYFLAAGLCLLEWLLSTMSWALYLSAKPTEEDDSESIYHLSDGFWICLVNSFFFLGMLVAVLFDKPEGLFEYHPKSGVSSTAKPSRIADDEEPDSLEKALV